MADLSEYLPRLPADTLALFEVTSGLMVLNVDHATFLSAARNYGTEAATPEDIELFSTINHETYHYFQTLATGFQYAYASEVWRLIVEESNAQQCRREVQQTKDREGEKAIESQIKEAAKTELQPKDESEAAVLKAVSTDFDERSATWAKRFAGFQELVRQVEKAHSWEDWAQGDFSVLAAELPSLAKGLGHLWAKIRKPGARGLSAEDLIEGSAIVFQHLLTHGREGLEKRLAKAWDEAAETYRKGFNIAQEICGARALDIVLPATALALRYSNPPEAYVVFVEKLKASEPGKEISEACALAAKPVQIEAAGEYLGTALDVRSKQRRTDDDHYPVYDDVLDKLEKRAWAFDEIELLSDRGPAQQINDFPFVTVVRGSIIRTDMDSMLLLKRVLCASLVLRTVKLPRYRRDAEQRLADRLHPAVAALVDPLQGAAEYQELGLKYLDEGNTDQAQFMLERARTLYDRADYKKGVASAVYNLGLVHSARNDPKRAQEMYSDSLRLSEEVQDDELTAMSANNLGDAYMHVGRLDDAETLLLRALAIHERLGGKSSMAVSCVNLGRIYYARKQMDQARQFFTRALDLYRAVGNRKMVEAIESGLAGMDESSERASQTAG